MEFLGFISSLESKKNMGNRASDNVDGERGRGRGRYIMKDIL